MTLQLDTRQRAMLEAMHIRVWQPEPPVAANAIVSGAETQDGKRVKGLSESKKPVLTTRPPAAVPAPVPAAAAMPAPAATPAPAAAGAAAYTLAPAQLLFTGLDPAQAPADRGAGWLLVTEAHGHPQDPWAGDAGQLLANMLRAMRLHQHPRVFRACLERRPQAAGGAGLQADLATLLAELQPSVVLAMGRVAAQALLQRRDPLGPLRGQVHQLHGVPLVVTFDAPYLLRAPADKARAWADLCLALELVAPAP
jgi:DNA polymerase